MIDFIFIQGLKRSGNHLIINWVLNLYSNPIYYNNISTNENKIDLIRYKETSPIAQENNDLYLINLETPYLLNINNLNEILKITKEKANYTNYFNFNIIRDPLNWYCSSLICMLKNKKTEFNHKNIKNISNKYSSLLWNQYIKTMTLYKDTNLINYNEFIKNKNYRIELCNKIKKIFNDSKDEESLNTSKKFPGMSLVSSFDDDKIDAKIIQPKEMDVLNRYKSYKYLFNKISDKIINISNKFWPNLINDISN